MKTKALRIYFFAVLCVFIFLFAGGKALAAGVLVGANNAELLMDFLSTDTAKQAQGMKIIGDAGAAGIPFIRFFATGYYSDTLNEYVNDPEGFWAGFDKLVAAANANNVELVPSFVLNRRQIETYLGATDDPTMCHDLLIGGSDANNFLKKITKDIVNRYKNNRAILFWEIGNEFSLIADLDKGGITDNNIRCNSTTDQVIAFLKDFAVFIKQNDPGRDISTGNSVPRTMAQHLRNDDNWQADTIDQFKKNLIDLTPDPINIVSVHLYNGDVESSGSRSNDRFGITGANDASLIDIINDATTAAGKKLFIGEFGDMVPHIQGSICGLPEDKSAPFSQNVLAKIAQLNVPYAAIWEWEAPRDNCGEQRAAFRVAPQETDAIIKLIAQTNGTVIKTCQNQCQATGVTQCSGSGYQTCGDFNNDGCLEWSIATDCPPNQICSNGACVTSEITGQSSNSNSSSGGRTANPNQTNNAVGATVSGPAAGNAIASHESSTSAKPVTPMTRAEILAKIGEIKKLLIQLIQQLIVELQKQLLVIKK